MLSTDVLEVAVTCDASQYLVWFTVVLFMSSVAYVTLFKSSTSMRLSQVSKQGLLAVVAMSGPFRAAAACHTMQVRVFSNHEHTRALTAHDVWAVVGSSTDLAPLAARSADVSLAAPSSGTVLWADLWTVPMHATGGSQMKGPSPLLSAWLEFGLMPSRVQHGRALQQGATPLQLFGTVASSTEGMQDGTSAVDELIAGRLPNAQTLACSEFLLPQDQETIHMYNSLLEHLNVSAE